MMLTLLVESGCQLSWQSGAIRVEKSGGQLRKIPVNQLESVWIKGKVQCDSLLLIRLANHGVAVSMMPVRGKDQVTYVGRPAKSGARLRLAQSRVWCNPQTRQAMTVLILKSKIAGYQLALCHSGFNAHKMKTTVFRQCINDTHSALLKNPSYQAILGLEGALARAWFDVVRDVSDTRFHFAKRNRRPPKDPINALMSFCYSLTLADVTNTMQTRGFDGAFGFLHELLPGRDSLALDLLEPFRPLMDVFCLVLAQEHLNPNDFYYEIDGACRLRKTATSLFFGQFHRYRLDPFVDFSLPEQSELWPHQPQLMDGESIPWLIRQLTDGLAKSLYQLADMETNDDDPVDIVTDPFG